MLLVINTLLFNGWGIVIWLIQMAWIPFWAAGVINGVGHYFGYRNWITKDKSKNIFPLGILIGGEELHNNHHNKPASTKLSDKWYEFDIGWMWLNILKFLRLAK
jgi:stearoyl-CoA desaturase (delta-9 desaturase)